MSLCKDCNNAGLCVILQQLKEQTILEFPDGKVAIVSMEDSLLSCDHHVPVGVSAAGYEPGDDPDYGYIGAEDEHGDAPPPPGLPPQDPAPAAANPTQGPAWTQEPPAQPAQGEVITYGPNGPQVAPAGSLPGLFPDDDSGSAARAPAHRPQRLSLTNMRGLG